MNPFATASMSVGYATARPPVHAKVVAKALQGHELSGQRALDVGCGAGLSTRALEGFFEERVGMEPAEGMLGMAKSVGGDAGFAVGRAEALPFRDQSFGWLTAAGSLNYVGLEAFFGEARRVLDQEGRVLVYDFSPGRSFAGSAALDDWFTRFVERYPWKASEALALDPERLHGLGMGFGVEASEKFELGVPLSREFYVNYMMTESNVAYAVRRGVDEASIRGWVEQTLPETGWGPVLFRGYWAIMRVWN